MPAPKRHTNNLNRSHRADDVSTTVKEPSLTTSASDVSPPPKGPPIASHDADHRAHTAHRYASHAQGCPDPLEKAKRSGFRRISQEISRPPHQRRLQNSQRTLSYHQHLKRVTSPYKPSTVTKTTTRRHDLLRRPETHSTPMSGKNSISPVSRTQQVSSLDSQRALATTLCTRPKGPGHTSHAPFLMKRPKLCRGAK